jgi:hypothetical protein
MIAWRRATASPATEDGCNGKEDVGTCGKVTVTDDFSSLTR